MAPFSLKQHRQPPLPDNSSKTQAVALTNAMNLLYKEKHRMPLHNLQHCWVCRSLGTPSCNMPGF